ncbi:MAG: porphobilinogen synthase [Phycisphaerae bacterium]|nr:porphobilinogen synthase [Phycisphaerae bacterium]
MGFPAYRARRLRDHAVLREMVAETSLEVRRLVQPLFVKEGLKSRAPIPSMPGQAQLGLEELVVEARRVRDAGVPAVLLFGVPKKKDAVGSSATEPEGIIARSVRALKAEVPDLAVIVDVCLCEYTEHGHCGILKTGNRKPETGKGKRRGGLSFRSPGSGLRVDNDATLERLARMAVVAAEAGADMVAPSDMMDGRVGAIRRALDAAKYAHVPIMSYAAKYASHFYGPFRDAAESAPEFGDRHGYQMDFRNSDEALREVAADIEEGADIVMVKPALAYGDIIRRVKERFGVPVAAYNVSGEYAMVEAASAQGWLDRPAVIREILTSLRRAGADILVTYWAREVAERAG